MHRAPIHTAVLCRAGFPVEAALSPTKSIDCERLGCGPRAVGIPTAVLWVLLRLRTEVLTSSPPGSESKEPDSLSPEQSACCGYRGPSGGHCCQKLPGSAGAQQACPLHSEQVLHNLHRLPVDPAVGCRCPEEGLDELPLSQALTLHAKKWPEAALQQGWEG